MLIPDLTGTGKCGVLMVKQTSSKKSPEHFCQSICLWSETQIRWWQWSLSQTERIKQYGVHNWEPSQSSDLCVIDLLWSFCNGPFKQDMPRSTWTETICVEHLADFIQILANKPSLYSSSHSFCIFLRFCVSIFVRKHHVAVKCHV